MLYCGGRGGREGVSRTSIYMLGEFFPRRLLFPLVPSLGVFLHGLLPIILVVNHL